MTILFIDDDLDDTELFCEAVDYLNKNESFDGREDIKCISINDGCKAAELLSTFGVPDFIFLDVNMPIMNGRECLKFLKTNQTYAKTPIIMLSTSFSESDHEEFNLLGAVACIKKPTEFSALVKLLSKCVYNTL